MTACLCLRDDSVSSRKVTWGEPSFECEHFSDAQMFTGSSNFRFSGSWFGPQSVSGGETPGGCFKHSTLIWKSFPGWQKTEPTPTPMPSQYRKLEAGACIRMVPLTGLMPPLPESQFWQQFPSRRKLQAVSFYVSHKVIRKSCFMCLSHNRAIWTKCCSHWWGTSEWRTTANLLKITCNNVQTCLVVDCKKSCCWPIRTVQRRLCPDLDTKTQHLLCPRLNW